MRGPDELLRSRDDGFTLIELILATAILGLVLTPIAMAFTMGLKTQAVTDEVVLSSQAPRLLAAYLTTDVQSADAIALTAAPTCAGPAGSTGRLGLTYEDNSGATTGAITYSQVTAAPGIQLHRTACGSAGTGTVIVASPLEAAVTATCAPPTCAAGSAVTVTIDPLTHEPTSLTITPRVGG
jgi:prepilin-type N-terminal cleavage/methylation domain-containing protein